MANKRKGGGRLAGLALQARAIFETVSSSVSYLTHSNTRTQPNSSERINPFCPTGEEITKNTLRDKSEQPFCSKEEEMEKCTKKEGREWILKTREKWKKSLASLDCMASSSIALTTSFVSCWVSLPPRPSRSSSFHNTPLVGRNPADHMVLHPLRDMCTPSQPMPSFGRFFKLSDRTWISIPKLKKTNITARLDRQLNFTKQEIGSGVEIFKWISIEKC